MGLIMLEDLLTIVVPVKNEEQNLSVCLENIKSFKYVVVVDSNSTDRTCEIAAEYWREVVQFNWNGHFPKKRNWLLRTYSFQTPWVMFLDADERLMPKWLEETEQKLANAPEDVDAWICYYDNWFLGRLLRHGDVMRKTAILRVGHGEYERIEEDHWSCLDMEIHEHLQVKGNIGVIKSRLEHQDRRDLDSYRKKHEEYANWEASRYIELRGDFARLTQRQRIKYTLIKWRWFGLAYFFISYFFKGGWLDGHAGYVFARGKWLYFSDIRRKIGMKKSS